MSGTIFEMISGKNKVSNTEEKSFKRKIIELDEDDEDEMIIKKESSNEIKRKKVKIENLVEEFIEAHELVVDWEKWFDKQEKKGKDAKKLENSEYFSDYTEAVSTANKLFSKIKNELGNQELKVVNILKGRWQ